MKKVLIDARLASLRHAGLGRYSLNFLHFLRKIGRADNYRYHLAIRRQQLPLFKKKFADFYHYHFLEARHYSWQEQWQFPRLAWQLRPDLVYFPHFNVPLWLPSPFVVTVHDLIKHHSRGRETSSRHYWQFRLKRWGYALVFRHTVMAARAIITPSRWTADDLGRHYPQVRRKITVIPEGVDSNLRRQVIRPPRQQLLQIVQRRTPYLLYVGSLYPHKNLSVVLQALASWQGEPKPFLLVVSARSIFRQRFWQEVGHYHLGRWVKLLGFVSDNDLAFLYRRALALVFPSKLEGFGLPGLEAMANNCPVIAARAAALPEVYGSAALYFPANNPQVLRQQIQRLQASPEQRQQLIRRGRQRAKQFSWERMTQRIVAIFRHFLE